MPRALCVIHTTKQSVFVFGFVFVLTSARTRKVGGVGGVGKVGGVGSHAAAPDAYTAITPSMDKEALDFARVSEIKRMDK